jgi:hypothetical protein
MMKLKETCLLECPNIGTRKLQFGKGLAVRISDMLLEMTVLPCKVVNFFDIK